MGFHISCHHTPDNGVVLRHVVNILVKTLSAVSTVLARSLLYPFLSSSIVLLAALRVICTTSSGAIAFITLNGLRY